MSHVCFNTCMPSSCNASSSKQEKNALLHMYVFEHCLDILRNGVWKSPKYSVLPHKEQIRVVNWICSQWKHTLWMPSCKDRKPDSFLLNRAVEEIHVAVHVWITTIPLFQPSHLVLWLMQIIYFRHVIMRDFCGIVKSLKLYANFWSWRQKTLFLQGWTR